MWKMQPGCRGHVSGGQGQACQRRAAPAPRAPGCAATLGGAASVPC